jgi:hypothetical protein
VARKAAIKEVVLSEKQAKGYDRGEDRKHVEFKRMDLAAEKYGLKVSYFKKLINIGKLTRYKLGGATLIDCRELERLIVADVGNHGPQAAPQVATR